VRAENVSTARGPTCFSILIVLLVGGCSDRPVGSADAGDSSVVPVCDVEELRAPDAGVRDLGGLECLAGLNTLTLYNNQITDLAPLATLTGLEHLNLKVRISVVGPATLPCSAAARYPAPGI
jgi:hypothetical protein